MPPGCPGSLLRSTYNTTATASSLFPSGGAGAGAAPTAKPPTLRGLGWTDGCWYVEVKHGEEMFILEAKDGRRLCCGEAQDGRRLCRYEVVSSVGRRWLMVAGGKSTSI